MGDPLYLLALLQIRFFFFKMTGFLSFLLHFNAFCVVLELVLSGSVRLFVILTLISIFLFFTFKIQVGYIYWAQAFIIYNYLLYGQFANIIQQ